MVRRGAGALIAAMCLFSADAAQAEELDAGTRTAARELARQGADAFESLDYAKALDRFDRAYALFQAPSIAVMQARALARLHRLVEALDRYEDTQRMPLPDDAPEAFRQAVADAKREGEELRLRIPRLAIRILTSGARPEPLTVMLDGKQVPRALLDVERPVDPGVHEISAEAPGYAALSRKLKLSEGQRIAIDLALQPLRTASARPAPSLEPKLPVREVSEPSRPDRTWAFVGLGIGAAGLSVSAVTGLIALSKKSDLDSVCKPGCPEDSRDDIDSFRTNRTVSYASLALGLTSAGIGSYLLFSGPGDSSQLAAAVSPQGVSLLGRF
jgi:hypothetical protein